MSDDEMPAFRLDLSVPDKLTDEDRARAMTWLQDLAEQLATNEGKELAIQVTGVYDDEYPPDDDGSSEGEPESLVADEPGAAEATAFSLQACSSKKAVINIMVCPGRRPYG